MPKLQLEVINSFLLLLGVIAIVVIYQRSKQRAKQAQRDALLAEFGDEGFVQLVEQLGEARCRGILAKYSDMAIAKQILTRTFWKGQTSEMLIDALGSPVTTDKKVLKTKTKETYKYRQTGKNRFALKIFLEDDVVTGWEQKDS